MRKSYLNIIVTLIMVLAISPMFAQVITGTIKDKTTGEPLIGVTVLVKGTTNGTTTDFDGNFSLDAQTPPPFTLTISYLGYDPVDVTMTDANISAPLKLSLNQVSVQTGTVEVVDTRITEKQKESPLTVESMGISAIKETPAANFYEGLGHMKGVDLTSASIGFKVINTRGFNSTSPVRSLQIIDGVDNQSPGLNFSLGNFLGASELDVQKVDLIVGASSAFYGPNAFNGVISMSTKDPFIHKGLSISLKGAERALFEGAVRWAQPFKNKAGRDIFAYKLNFYYLRANDWEADNLAPVDDALVGTDNPGGYDAVNRYGDENLSPGINNATSTSEMYITHPGLGRWHRDGYEEKDVVNYNTENYKANIGLYFKLTEDIQLIMSSSYGTGTTVYQGDNRYSLKGIKFFQNRLEIKQDDKFFVRFYATNEDAGDSYDAVFTAYKMQELSKSDGDWSSDYRSYWGSNITNRVRNLEGFPDPPGVGQAPDSVAVWAVLAENKDSLIKWHQEARDFANSENIKGGARIEPGSFEFDSLFNDITSKEAYAEGGTKFFDRSALYHAQAEYKFKPKWLDITVGGNFRLYVPNSHGTIFSDTAGRKITNNEFGFYAGLEKKFLDNKLKANITARLDKNKNFPFLVSPAASLVYSPTVDHTLRFSFSAAIRNPTLQDQYLYYNVGRAILIGNLNGFDNLVTIESFQDAFAGITIDRSKLVYFNVAPVVPEKVKTVEVGYRATLFKKVFLDASYYFSFYKDFIGYNLGLQVDTVGGIDLNSVQAYRVASNATSRVTTQGFSIGVNYFFYKFLAFNANYSWNKLNKSGADDPLIPAFNTPEHKFNIGFSGRDITFNSKKPNLNNWGFSINYKWVQGFVFEGSPQFTGTVPQYDLLDVQINKAIPKIYTTFKLGAQNVINNEHIEVYGGPYIGRMVYGSIVFEFDKINKR